MAITKQQRQKAEKLIYDTLDAADKTGSNTQYYKEIFAGMSDEQFFKFFKRRLPIRFHQEIFKVEPKMYDIFEAFDVLQKPLMEKVKLPYLYQNEDGVPIESKEALVIYIHLKRMKQMLAKKTNTSMDISNRDMKTGLLVSNDKGGKETDREFESLAAMGLENTMDEYSRSKADSMKAKSEMYNVIAAKGFVTKDDVQIDRDDSLSKNMLYTYMLGANIFTNLLGDSYMTPLTIKNKQGGIERK